jgi:hypothetical protein
LVVERIVRFAKLVGDVSLALAKLYALSESARLETDAAAWIITSDSQKHIVVVTAIPG